MTRTISRRNIIQGSFAMAVSQVLGFDARARDASPAASAAQFDGKSTAEEVTAGLDLRGRTALITGCSSGIGQETLRVLVLRGARVYGLAPTLAKAESGCAAARTTQAKGTAIALACDHTDFPSIVGCADAVRKLGTPLDMFICNAGINLQRLERVNGIEKDFVVNHLGHFILVNRLLGLVEKAQQGRIIVVGSGASVYASAGIEFDNLSG